MTGWTNLSAYSLMSIYRVIGTSSFINLSSINHVGMSNTASPWSSTRLAARYLLKLGVKVLALLDRLVSWIYVLQIFHHHQVVVHLHLGLF